MSPWRRPARRWPRKQVAGAGGRQRIIKDKIRRHGQAVDDPYGSSRGTHNYPSPNAARSHRCEMVRAMNWGRRGRETPRASLDRRCRHRSGVRTYTFAKVVVSIE